MTALPESVVFLETKGKSAKVDKIMKKMKIVKSEDKKDEVALLESEPANKLYFVFPLVHLILLWLGFILLFLTLAVKVNTEMNST